MEVVVGALFNWTPASEEKGRRKEGRNECECAPDECLLTGVLVGVEWNAAARLVVVLFNADLHSRVVEVDDAVMRTMVGIVCN